MRVWRIERSTPFLAVIAVALVACASPPSPPSPPTATETTTASQRYGAPIIATPLDVSSIYNDPCSQLTRAELATFEVRERGDRRSYLGDSECDWNSEGGDILSLAVDRDRDLLVDTYRTQLLPIFQPVRVAGYPAVREMTRPEYNICTVTIGLGPKQALRSDWTGLGSLKPGINPCERAETAAAMVIRKLPPQR